MAIRNKIRDIELLRGIAVLAVIIHHLRDNLFTWVEAPLEPTGLSLQLWWGVDLFFVISGYVITRSVYPALQSASDTRGYWRTSLQFWIRRAWRLLPTAWLWLGIAVLLAAFFNQSGAFGTVATNVQAGLAGFLHYANVRFATSFLTYDYGVSFVYWSLSLEEQFYFLFPLLVFLLRRWLIAVLALVVLIQLPLDRGIWMVAFRTDALAMGILIALWQQRKQTLTLPLVDRIPVAARPLLTVALLVIMWLAANANLSGRQIQFSLVAWISALLVILAAQNRDLLLAPGRFKQGLCWVGSRSYGIYIIHIPAFLLTREIWYRLAPQGTQFGAEWTVPFLLTAMLLLVGLSELNFRFVEKPLRDRGREIANRARLTPAAMDPPRATDTVTLGMVAEAVIEAQESSMTTRNN